MARSAFSSVKRSVRKIRKDALKDRNLEIFWAAMRDEQTQTEIARKYDISQQRVSEIIRDVSVYVALSPCEEFEGRPQLSSLQYAYRVHEAKMRKLARTGWDMIERSAEPVIEGKTREGDVNFTERTLKHRHGDWRLLREVREIEEQIKTCRIVLYGRNWRGYEELETSGMVAEGGLTDPSRRPQPAPPRPPRKYPNDVVVSIDSYAKQAAVSAGVAERGRGGDEERGIQQAEFAARGTVGAAPQSAIHNPQSAMSAGSAACQAKGAKSAVPPISPSPTLPLSPSEPITRSEFLAPKPATIQAAVEQQKDVRPAVAAGVRSLGGPSVVTQIVKPVREKPERRWMTGPDPQEVLLRDVSKMTAEEYEAHLKDIEIMKKLGSYVEPAFQRVVYICEAPSAG